MEQCLEHSGVVARLDSLEKTGSNMDRAIGSAHRRIDGMKNWVIAGMSSLVLQLIVVLAGLIIILNRK